MKLKVLEWQKRNLEKTLDTLVEKFSRTGSFTNTQTKVLMKYERKIEQLKQKIEVEKLKELKE